MRKRTGFSIIELMIVLVIIGILFAVAIPSYIQHTERSQREEANFYAHNIKPAVSRCIKKQLALQRSDYSACKSGVFGIPNVISTKAKGSTILCFLVKDGVITVLASLNTNEKAEYSLRLTPKYNNNQVYFTEEMGTIETNSLHSCT